MIQDGLHIGLAAWITAQRESEGFVVCPAIPFSTELTTLESGVTMTNLKRVAEFARMVNFCPRKGQYAEQSAPSGFLWEVHRGLLEDMEFALRPWTDAEDTAWRTARSLLYETGSDGRETVSDIFRLYDEYRITHSELFAAGAEAPALNAVLADWLVLGQKMQVESALSTLNRLALRSSLPEAQAAASSLDPGFLPSTDDDTYAPTIFSPLSAIDTDMWLTAEATLEELSQAVGDMQPREKWDAWRGTKTGIVRFKFTALEIRRPWFQFGIYDADDWRLPHNSAASTGNGVDGVLPAYVAALYLAIVDDVRISTAPPILRLPERPWPSRLQTQLDRHMLTAVQPTSEPKALERRVPETAMARLPAVVNSERVMQLPSFHGRLGEFGRIELLTQASALRRVALANNIVRDLVPVPEAPKPPVYVVGYGCEPIPAAPHPNHDYTWPAL